MRHTFPPSAGTPASLRPFQVLALTVFVLFLTAGSSLAQTLPLSSPEQLLATDSVLFATLLGRGRPTAVSPAEMARILRTLPERGEVTKLDQAARAKLAAVDHLLRAMTRDGVYAIKIIDVPQAVVGLYARAVVLVSERALELVSADELQALVAHEIGHEYVWAAYERAVASKDRSQIRQLELVCDGIAIVTLRQLGIDHSRLTVAIGKVAGFNRLHFGDAVSESNYPTLAERRAYARAVSAWAAGTGDRER
jgi:hypothetical protein